MLLSRLRGRKVCARVLAHGNVWKGKTFSVTWLPGRPRHPAAEGSPPVFLGTFGTTKLSPSAVKRNRMRRRCREAFRIVIRDITDFPPVQLLVSPRSSSLSCAFPEIVEDVSAFLSFLRSCLKHPNGEATSSSSR